MTKNIVIEIEDGIIQSVYCPDEEHSVHVLDLGCAAMYLRATDQSVAEYFADVEKEIKNLKDCYSKTNGLDITDT